MGILRFLFRLFSAGPKPRNTTYQSEEFWVPPKRVKQPPPLAYAGPNKVLYGVTLVESLRGRCYVVDGDTITIGKTNIRLCGIDAPEMDQPFGKNAKWALFNLCNGHEIKAEFADHFS